MSASVARIVGAALVGLPVVVPLAVLCLMGHANIAGAIVLGAGPAVIGAACIVAGIFLILRSQA